MVYPEQPEAVDFSRPLAQLVDAVAESAADVDAAYYLLEEMHAQVGLATGGLFPVMSRRCP